MALKIDSPAAAAPTPRPTSVVPQVAKAVEKVVDTVLSLFEQVDPNAKNQLEKLRGQIDHALDSFAGPPPAQPPSTPSTPTVTHHAPNTPPKPTATRSTSSVPTSDLSQGMRGPQVELLQKDLVKLGYMTQSAMNTGPGIFGPHTHASLQAFQSAWGLPTTGKFDAASRAALTKALAGQKPPAPTGGNMAIVNTAINWMHHGHINPNTGNEQWSGWCLGFVHAVDQAATGKSDPQLVAGNATQAFHQMQAAGRVHYDTKNFAGMPPGSFVFWGPGDHVCIYTGKRDANGSPIMITTGNWRDAHNGIAEHSIAEISRYDGQPSGWVAPL
jgi:hypothetical protein